MNVIVYDYKRNEMKVGTRVIYGSSENIATVTAISEPDVVCDEDEWGREYAHRIEVDISIRFDDGRVSLAWPGVTSVLPGFLSSDRFLTVHRGCQNMGWRIPGAAGRG